MRSLISWWKRNDSEQTLLDTLHENYSLRHKLSSFHSQCAAVTNARSRLQHFVVSFGTYRDTYRNEYKQALKRIRVIECQLYEAHSTITLFEDFKGRIVAASNQSLYEELVAPNSSLVVNKPDFAMILDLTNGDDSRFNKPQKVIKFSKNKLKSKFVLKRLLHKKALLKK